MRARALVLNKNMLVAKADISGLAICAGVEAETDKT